MNALKYSFLTFVVLGSGLIQACGQEEPVKKPSNNLTPPSTEFPSGGVSFTGGAPVIQVTGATGSSLNVPIGQPVSINYSITNYANASDLQMVMVENPVGGQLLNQTTAYPQFSWQLPTAGSFRVTLFVRNMALCMASGVSTQCQMSSTPVFNAAYDAQSTIMLNVGGTGTGVDPVTGLPLDPGTGGIDPNTGLPIGGGILGGICQKLPAFLQSFCFGMSGGAGMSGGSLIPGSF